MPASGVDSKTTGLYASYSNTDIASPLNDNMDPDLSEMNTAQLHNFFTHYRNWVRRVKEESAQVYIHSIVKPHARKKGGFYPSQLFAVPAKTSFIDKSILNAKSFYDQTKNCLWCEMIQQETQTKHRTVVENNTYIAFETFFSRMPFETFVVPKQHNPAFHNISDTYLADLAVICADLFARLETVTNKADFSLHLHNVIVPSQFAYCTHWYLQIVPWMNNWAGFEIATAMYINVTKPEQCAQQLRRQKEF